MKRRIVSVLLVGFCAFWSQGCTSSTQRSCKANPFCESNDAALAGRIKQEVVALGYADKEADEFAGVVLGWKDGRDPVVVTLAGKISYIVVRIS